MQQLATLRNLCHLFVCLLQKFFAIIYSCAEMQPQRVPLETGGEQQQRCGPRTQRESTAYDKVDLLHRMLVAQQLQQLEQRRLMRLALARRRLDLTSS